MDPTNADLQDWHDLNLVIDDWRSHRKRKTHRDEFNIQDLRMLTLQLHSENWSRLVPPRIRKGGLQVTQIFDTDELDVLMLVIPSGMGIQAHTHGKHTVGTSTVFTGSLQETRYSCITGCASHDTLQHREYKTLNAGTVNPVDRRLMHAVSNIERGDPAVVFECFSPKLDFRIRHIEGITIA